MAGTKGGTLVLGGLSIYIYIDLPMDATNALVLFNKKKRKNYSYFLLKR